MNSCCRSFDKLMIFACMLSSAGVFGQPTLNPEQTVDLTTGAMRFSLPLATVKGVNGHDYPITLNYRAGIPLHAEASPAGLGFSIMPGGISRRVVFVPDHSEGINSADRSYSREGLSYGAEMKTWYRNWQNVLFCIQWIVGGIGPWGWLSNCYQMYKMANPEAAPTPSISSFNAGGPNTSRYPLEGYLLDYNTGREKYPDAGYSVGFFHGSNADLPDIYIVNTPYVSGWLIWVGDPSTGHFEMKTGPGAGNNSIQVEMVPDLANRSETFRIVLADGTKLYFEEQALGDEGTELFSTSETNATRSYITASNSKYYVTNQWLLTKVVFPDFQGDLSNLEGNSSNKGSWIKFEYDRNVAERFARQQYVSQGAAKGLLRVDCPIYFEDKYLTKIVTPEQEAQISYCFGRKDDLWFTFPLNSGWNNVFNNLDENQPRENSYYWNKSNEPSTTKPEIVQRPVFAEINIFYKNQSAPVSKVKFHASYSLRPNSFYSWFKGIGNQWTTMSETENPRGSSLTLDSISLYGANDCALGKIRFSYVDYNPRGWNYAKYGTLPTKVESQFNYGYYLEERDLWGYYCPFNPANPSINDFNPNGTKNRVVGNSPNLPYPDFPYAAAWSLKKVQLPSGKSIEWIYEANRYRWANGVSVAGGSSQYGGGIRVKTIKAGNGLGQSDDISLFYTNSAGTFVENETNSSGYTTALPINNLVENDSRPAATQGGLYTSMALQYQMVQMVKNYNVSNPSSAPAGYTVFEFTHCGDPSRTGFYENLGQYGDIDRSWMRGLPLSTTVRDKNNKIISSTQNTYEMNYGGSMMDKGETGNTIDLFKKYPLKDYPAFGWAKLSKTVSTQNGVQKTQKISYGDSDPSSPDYRSKSFSTTKLVFSNSSPRITHAYSWDFQQSQCAYADGLNNDPGVPYIFLLNMVKTVYDDTVKIQCISNPALLTGNPTASFSNGLNICTTYPNAGNAVLAGADFVNFDGDGKKNDLVILKGGRSTPSTAQIVVLRNVSVSSSGVISFAEKKQVISNALASFWGSSGSPLTGAIGEIDGDGFLDIMFYRPDQIQMGAVVVSHFILNGSINTANYYSLPFSSKITYSTLRIGPKAHFIDFHNDGKQNDLITSTEDKAGNIYVIKDTRVFDLLKRAGPIGDCSAIDEYLHPPAINDHYGTAIFCGILPINCATSIIIPYYVQDLSNGNDPLEPTMIQNFNINMAWDFDGLPNTVSSTGSDGKLLANKSIPAYWKPEYAAMKAANILTAPCQSIIYEKASGDNSALAPADVRSASATTFRNDRGCASWVPYQSFTWKVNKNQDGSISAGNTFADITDWANPAGTANWKLTGSIVKYNSFGIPIMTQPPLAGSAPTSTNIRSDIQMPMGTITGAHWDECGVFTGDYDLSVQNAGYLDYENGWTKSDTKMPDGINYRTRIVNEITHPRYVHFGQNSLFINTDYGTSRVSRLDPGDAYIMSAWAIVEVGTLIMTTDFRYTASNYTWPVQGATWVPSFGSVTSTLSAQQCRGQWKRIQILIPASKTTELYANPAYAGKVWFAQAKVGFDPAGAVSSGIAFLDDIRFAPAKSLVTTTYYDSKWHQPILTVDANGNPSQRVVYDDFGRPIEWWEIDKTAGGFTNAKKVKEKSYYLMGEIASMPFKEGLRYKIVSKVNTSKCIDIAGPTFANGSAMQVGGYSGGNGQKWSFKPAGNGYYYLVPVGGTAYGINDPNGVTANGTLLNLQKVDNNNQKWKIIPGPAGSSYYKFECKGKAGTYIDIVGGDDNSIGDGDRLRLYQSSSNNCQLWSIVCTEPPNEPNTGSAVKSGLNLNLTWKGGSLFSSDLITYQIEIYTEDYVCTRDVLTGQYICVWMSPFSQAVAETTTSALGSVTDLSATISNFPGVVQANRRYNWRVKAISSGGAEISNSTMGAFTWN